MLRANVPAAMASTLVTNPLTFGPIYYAAWKVGHAILGAPENAPQASVTATATAQESLDEAADEGWWRAAVRRVLGVGKPLMLGLAILATGFGLATYFLVSLAWKLSVLWKRHRRRQACEDLQGAAQSDCKKQAKDTEKAARDAAKKSTKG